MAKFKLLTLAEFNALRPKLRQRLTDALERELRDCALPDLGSDPDTDLWELPPVDSKTVAKLSPVVKELMGRQLHPTWIRRGGYVSIEAAVQDLLAQIRTHCVVEGAIESASRAIPVGLTP